MRKVDDLPSNPRPSRLVCDRGEIVSNIVDRLHVAGIAVEIRPSIRPDHIGKTERAFCTNKEFQNV